MFDQPRSDSASPKVPVFATLALLTLAFSGGAIILLSGGFDRYVATILIASGFLALGVLAALLFRTQLEQGRNHEIAALTDALCDLPNRRALHQTVRNTVTSGTEVAVALVDLDGFKMVNDLYGHGVGDQLIREVSLVLVDVCGDEAKPFRLSGDEFAICMTGPLCNTIIEGVSRALIERLAQPLAIEDRRIAVGASVGLSGSNGKDGHDSSELLRRADVAMYASKKGGKMRCTWFKPEFDRNLEAIRNMDVQLRHALLNEEFVVHYQPLVDAQSRAVVAVESLIRWNRPDGQKIGPNVFIPVAEESGLINAIGLFVLRQSCRDAIDWNGIKLSVNISAAQLRNPEFPIQLGQILEETGFEPERLELEITETCLVLDPVVAERSLEIIRSFGVNVVLDDFGTGYASIGFLRQFRFEKLKLDRSLVVDSADDEGSRAMMLSSISMAQALKMHVTAEGVETEAQADLVRAAGCDQIQGWLYFKAMPKDEIQQHLGPLMPGNDAQKDPARRTA